MAHATPSSMAGKRVLITGASSGLGAADGIIEALGRDRFEHYVPDMKAVVDAKNADLDAFIAGVASMAPR
jgi:NAD(P)-dependent dehydrogenase (short-subunit alcohol dehydrogenase family)